MRLRRSVLACGCAALFAWPLFGPAHAQQLDVTQLLLSRPEVASGIADLCARACAGNEARSWLEKATLTINGAAPMVLDATIKLKSKHVPAKGFPPLYDLPPASLDVTATIDAVTCNVGNVKLSSNNELYQAVITLLGPSLAGQFRNLGAAC
jgi:hypothetical protein